MINDENGLDEMNYKATATATTTGAFCSFPFFGQSRDSFIHIIVFALNHQQQGQVHSGLAVHFLT